MKPHLEHQFLPAILEIQETPPSPLSRGIIYIIAAFFISALLWATFGYIDIVAIAPGKIIPNGHVKIVQPLEIAKVSTIHVKEGQRVNKNEPLIDLDTHDIDVEITQLQDEYDLIQQQIKRFGQLLERQRKHSSKHAANDQVLESQWREYQEQLNALEAEKNKREAEYAASRQQAEKLNAILPMISQRAANEKKLADKKLFPKQQYLETEQQRLSYYYDLKSQLNKVNELKVTIVGIDAQINHARSEFVKTKLEKLEEARHKSDSIQQQLIKARNRKKAYHLMAPVGGKVQQLAIHTVGGIVTPAQQLMIIVPDNTLLKIEAYVKNKDIGFVREGQRAVIKLDAFPFTKYGTLDGEIISLSNDAIAEENKGLIYKAQVSLEQQTIQIEDKVFKLGPGMAASVEIKTGQRRLIEFILSPLLKYKDESFRER